MNIDNRVAPWRLTLAGLMVATVVALPACSKANDAAKTEAASSPTANTAKAVAGAPPLAAPQAAPQGPPPPPTAEAAAWSPTALDELLAPIALYPEPVLAQVLAASTDSQQVLDAGNWLLDNQALKGDELTKAAAKAGFGPSVQALLQFPTVLDMMCRELDWTKQLGDAFSADQAAVLAAVQRLRAQAAEVGNLKSSSQIDVKTTQQEGKDVIIVQPADPQIVYVPQYNPTTVYTQPAPAAAPATTTTTTTSDSGISTSEAVMGGVLAFGAGVLVANLFDDDDHDHDDYWGYPNYGYGGVYYGGHPYSRNTFVYAPRGAGYRPATGYRPAGGYGNQYNRNTNVNVNNNYMNRFDKNQNRMSNYQARSPVSAQNEARGAYKGRSANEAAGAAGARGGANEYRGANAPRPSDTAARDRGGQTTPNGTYRGASGERSGAGATQRPTASQRPSGGTDRGYPQASGSRPDASATNRGGGSFSGAGTQRGSSERAASQRGRDSMKAAPRPSSQQHASRSGGSGGGGRSGGRGR
jgi:hypothetical protein